MLVLIRINLQSQKSALGTRLHPDEYQHDQHGGRKPTETSVTEFYYKNVNLLPEELINIKVIPFLIHELLK